MKRRDWLVRVARGGTAGGALALSRALAADVSGEAMTSVAGEDFETTLARLGAARARLDERLVLDVPEEAWTGAMISVRIDVSRLGDVRVLHLLRDAHAPAAIVAFEPSGVQPAVLTVPVRLERPCRLRLVARLADGWLRRDAVVRTLGAPGCG